MKTVAVFSIILLMFCFPLSVAAYDNSDAEQIASAVGVDTITHPAVTNEELHGDTSINLWNKITGFFSEAFKTGGVSALKAFAAIMAMVIVSSLLSAVKQLFTNSALALTADYAAILALSGVTFAIITPVFSAVGQALSVLNTYMLSFLPVTAGLYAYGGNVAAAAASNSCLQAFLTFVSTVCSQMLLPFLQICFALCLTSALPGNVNLGSVFTLVRNTATTVLAFIFSLFGFVLYLQTSIAASRDGFAFRSLKFASGVFIPVIGGILGDAARTVAGSVSVVKSTVGAVGVTVIFAILLPPLVLVLTYKLAVLCSAILARILGCERESRFLYDLNGIFNVLMALTAGVCVVCLIGVAVFIKTTAQI